MGDPIREMYERALQDQTTSCVLQEIKDERLRQVQVEGWTHEHDDRHGRGEMGKAAACYAWAASASKTFRESGDWWDAVVLVRLWPWSRSWWKPKDRRRDLIRAAALIVAEIERLDREGREAGR